MNWKEIYLDECSKTFFYQETPLFLDKNIIDALKFHAPGLAPIQDTSGWFHINTQGNPIYVERYQRAFGFYENRATVVSNEGWYHINEDGKRLHSLTYSWCGNFQENRCSVKSKAGRFFHINLLGKSCYADEYQYVGDFKYGFACVMNDAQKFTHINKEGVFLHNNWFKDLGVFHKGFAIASDEEGWFHIDLFGKPIYTHRFALIEPFYNGAAFMKNFDGRRGVIYENGKVIYFG